ncbi:hypothetical protein G0Q06_02145 [Puniceicoccales bacterium CK1056]|uniref:IPT/TIG domain-containing protein n=1 Tax=Oceanipulchritudo coccoides TaxID=2706888 RepID=A0A6B2LZP7_9BACT|nr:IPT/TIG domain-containing protein [Oceanipulchritudo coccoides]NDV61247.1 hypothetical protein [Oceanipulchritudo coccoides]
METIRLITLCTALTIGHAAFPAGPELSHGGNLDFGLSASGSTRMTRYPITNTGDALLKVENVTMGGTNPWDFQFILRDEDKWILPRETVYATVTSTVYGAANYNASVLFESNAVNSPPAISLHSSTSWNGQNFPSVSFAYPELVEAGGILSLSGFGFGEDSASTLISYWDGANFENLEPLSVSETNIRAPAPEAWPSWDTEIELTLTVRVNGNDSNEVDLILTNNPPMQPVITFIDNTSGSPGDLLKIWGDGFAPNPSQNMVFFGGGSQLAQSYTFNGGDHGGIIEVVVPQGTGTETLSVRRTDGQPGSSVPVNFQRRPASVMTLSAGDESGGIRISGPGGDAHDHWVLSGTGFDQFRLRPYSGFDPGIIELEVTGPDDVWPAPLKAVMLDDGRLMVNLYSPWPNDLPPDHSEGINFLRDGDTVSVRAMGYELDNDYIRWSEPLILTAREIAAGSQTNITLWDDGSNSIPISRNTWLNISGYGHYTAPGLWTGSLHLNPEWFDESKKPRTAYGFPAFQIPGPDSGIFTIQNQDTGDQFELVVVPSGVPGLVTGTFPEAVTKGAEIHAGGARLIIPPNALPYYNGSEQSYTIQLAHMQVDESEELFDSAETSFGRQFQVQFDPEPDELRRTIQLIIPYDPNDYESSPEFGIRDPESHIFQRFPMDVNASDGTMILNIPAGPYGEAAAASGGFRQLSYIPDAVSNWFSDKKASLNVAFQYVAPVSWANTMGEKKNAEKGIYLKYVSGSGSSHTIPDSYANTAFATAESTYDYLVGAGWDKPSGLNLHFRSLGADIDGSTTKGVFGNPWVFIATGLESGKLNTTVSHEIGHAFQREYTTNLSTYWIDEATANWIAWRMHGMTSDLQEVFEAGSDFPTVSFPASRNSGFTQEQQYAAAVFFIWLSQTYGDAVIQQLYNNLWLSPSYWLNMRTLISDSASSGSFKSLVQQFADDYWSRNFVPVDSMSLPYAGSPIFGSGEVRRTITVPAYASKAHRFTHKVASQPEHEGVPVVIRASGIGTDQHVTVYASSDPSATPSWTRIGRLTTSKTGIDGGIYASPNRSWMGVVNNYSEEECTVELVWGFPQIQALSGSSFPQSGGLNLGITGLSFGDQTGKVYVGGYEAEIDSWNDSYISVLTPQFASGNFSASVTAETAEGVEIDSGFSVWISGD